MLRIRGVFESGSGSGSRILADYRPNPGFYDKIDSWKKIFFDQKLQFTCAFKKDVQSTQPPKENIQHFKTWNFFIFFYFCGSVLPSWIRIRILNLDLDPLTWLIFWYFERASIFLTTYVHAQMYSTICNKKKLKTVYWNFRTIYGVQEPSRNRVVVPARQAT